MPRSKPSIANPFMYVDLMAGTFLCIGCGNFGIIDTTLFNPIRHISLAELEKQNRHTKKVVLNPRVHELLSDCQTLLTSSLEYSEAANEFLDRSSFNRQVIADLGVGYGTCDIIETLLEKYTFKELKNVGLIKFIVNPDAESDLYQFLLNIGYSHEGIVEDKKADKRITHSNFAKPCFSLQGCVTFPLEIYNSITSFHSYALKTQKVSRLPVKGGRQLYGSFNWKQILSARQLIITDFSIEALALISMGYESVIAIESATNYVVLESILKSELDSIKIAFRPDKRGRNSTIRMLNWLEQMGYSGLTSDFTSDFFANIHKSSRFSGFYEWWQKVGSKD